MYYHSQLKFDEVDLWHWYNILSDLESLQEDQTV